MSPPAEAEFKQPGSVRVDAGMYPGRHPGREHHRGDSSVPGTAGEVQPGETRCAHMAKGPAEPMLSPPLPKGLLTPPTNQTAKASLQMNTLCCKELAKETHIPFADAASFPSPARLRRRGKFLSIARQRGICPPRRWSGTLGCSEHPTLLLPPQLPAKLPGAGGD